MSKFNCLMYHQIKENGDKYTLSKDSFLMQLDSINNQGYLARSLKDMAVNSTKKQVALTFDDGYKSDLWAGEKLLRYGFTATFFLVKDFIEDQGNDCMNKEELKELAMMGHEIGVHGKNHHAWTSKPITKLIDELTETKNWLQDITGEKVTSCSAVGGKINSRIKKEIIKSKQFKKVRNSVPWFNQLDAFEVNATAILRTDSDLQFENKVKGDESYYKYLFAKQKLKDYAKRVLVR